MPQAAGSPPGAESGHPGRNEERLRGVFAEALCLPPERVVDSLEYRGVPSWDSVAHLALVAAIDEAFETMLDTDDILDMSSFKKAKEIMAKYGVAF